MSPPGLTVIRSRHLSVGMQLYLGELPICYPFFGHWIFLDYSWTCPRRLLVYWWALLSDAAFRGHFVTPHGVTGIWKQIPNTAKNTTHTTPGLKIGLGRLYGAFKILCRHQTCVGITIFK